MVLLLKIKSCVLLKLQSFFFSKKCKLFCKVFPHKSFTKKSIGVRMGQGKGPVSLWVAPVKKGQILFELSNSNPIEAMIAFNKSLTKLSVKTKIFEKKKCIF